MALTRIDSYLVDLDSLGGITFDDQAGTPTFKVDAVNHRVGIGITNPTSKLTLKSPIYNHSENVTTSFPSTAGITILTSDAGSEAAGSNGAGIRFSQLWWGGSTDIVTTGAIYGYKRAPGGLFGGGLKFATSSVQQNYLETRMTIDDGGNVGIGTTNPEQKLHVLGNLRLGTDPYIQWVSNYIKFQTTTASVPVIELRESSSGNYEPRLDFYDGNGTTKNISIDANPSNSTYFNAGNVGIGTTNPRSKIDIRGNALIAANSTGNNILAFGNSDTYGPLNGAPDSSHGGAFIVGNSSTAPGAPSYMSFWTAVGGTVGEALRITSTGNVGIGTTNPAYKFEISQADYSRLTLLQSTTGKRWQIGNDGSNFYVFNESNAVRALDITSTGNVGIGVSNPITKLSVNGEISVGQDKKLSFIGLDINGSLPSYIKIRTSIPFVSASADFTVNIKGFRYNVAQIANLSISWHFYNGIFWNPAIISSGSWAPTVVLSNESGLVCITLYSPGYWPKLYVESMYSSVYSDSYCTGWSWVDEAPGGTNNVTVSYKSDFGNLFVMAGDGNVGVGTGSPTQKLEVNGNLLVGSSNYNNSNSPIIRLGHQSADLANGSQRGVIQFDSIQDVSVNSGDAWKWKIATVARAGNAGNYNSQFEILRTTRFGVTDNTDFCISRDGNVGIGTTNPEAKLHINGSLLVQNGSLLGGVEYNGAYTANTNLDITGFGTANYIVSIRSTGTYHWNGVLMVTYYDTADFGIATLVSGSYDTTATISMVPITFNSGTLRLVFNRNFDNIHIRRISLS
jgi:hypothetical protein